MQKELGLTYLFIAHDLAMVRYISQRVAVMYLGKLVEVADTEDLYEHPLHPYTQALLSAIPVPDPDNKKERIHLDGELPSPIDPPDGCRFCTRCPYATERCRTEEPVMKDFGNRRCACRDGIPRAEDREALKNFHRIKRCEGTNFLCSVSFFWDLCHNEKKKRQEGIWIYGSR